MNGGKPHGFITIPMPSDPPENVPGSNADAAPSTPLLPVNPSAAPSDPLPTSTSLASDSGLTPNVAAGLAVLFTLITGLIFLFLEKRNQFVRFWAMQAVFFGAAAFVCSVVCAVIGSVLGHILWIFGVLWGLCSLLVYLGLVIVWVVMLVQAFSGKEWEVPFLGKLARQQLNTLPKV